VGVVSNVAIRVAVSKRRFGVGESERKSAGATECTKVHEHGGLGKSNRHPCSGFTKAP